MFEASTKTGAFNVEEVEQFVQDDLCAEDVYFVDTYKQLFVWIGDDSTEEEKSKATEFASKFISDATDGRDSDMPVIRVHQGQEPAIFTQHFVGWDPEFFEKHTFKDPYAAKLAAMKAQEAQKVAEIAERDAAEAAAEAAAAPAAAPAAAAAAAAAAGTTYSPEELKGKIPGVEPHKKEDYLSDADFTSVFAMSRDEFRSLPAWKAKAAKQKVGLF
jgi:hypothetical protein